MVMLVHQRVQSLKVTNSYLPSGVSAANVHGGRSMTMLVCWKITGAISNLNIDLTMVCKWLIATHR